ncbi:hypothetical protein [Lysinibacter cavernae]|uniref:Uncharacterized protein n=1 Tax=Lysinibacter cavernae TaxID=1640652 RepID=A0A7X5TTY7_9MICO|nr:hypothetical protein [Lysinibacter cavernae]NIH53798.1 hypothetical protein [Lysinibacter cavernae]
MSEPPTTPENVHHHPQPVDGFQSWLWQAWPLTSWILAAYVAFHRLLFASGWETLMFLLLSPLIVPAIGLIESLPRFILRRRKHVTLPTPMAWILPTHWVFIVIATLSFEGSTDAAPTPSGLSVFSGQPIMETVEMAFAGVSLLVALATGTALLVLSIVSRPRGSKPMNPLRVSLAAGVPALLLVCAPMVAAGATSTIPDSEGTTLREIRTMPIGEQLVLVEKRYEEMQHEFSTIRGFADTGDWVDVDMVIDSADWSGSVERYQLELFATSADAIAIDKDAFTQDLKSLGYERSTYGTRWENPNGQAIELNEYETGAQLEFHSPQWWGDGDELRDRLDASTGALKSDRYAADAYPVFGAVAPAELANEWSERSWDRYLPYNYLDLEEEQADAAGEFREPVRERGSEDAGAATRPDDARAVFDGVVSLLGGSLSPDAVLDIDRRRWENSYAGGSGGGADQYFIVLQHTIAPPEEHTDWEAVADTLAADGWSDVISSRDGLAARHPTGDIVVAYDGPDGMVVALRTPPWWGSA